MKTPPLSDLDRAHRVLARIGSSRLNHVRDAVVTHAAAHPDLYGKPATMSNATWSRLPYPIRVDKAEFSAILANTRTHLLLVHGHNFHVGGILHLEETEHTGAEMRAGAPLVYTTRYVKRQITEIQTGRGLEDGWCILSFKRVEGAPPHD